MKYDFGICGECKYTVEELVNDNPPGAHEQEATAILINMEQMPEPVLVVMPHRETCSLHTNQKVCTA